MSCQAKNKSLSIEHTLRAIYKCDRSGFGGYIDADSIELNPVLSYVIGLAPIYIHADENKRKQIDKFLDDCYEYEGRKIDDIGIEIVEKLTEKFEELIR